MTKNSILLVEDEVLLCWVLDEAMRECGYEVRTLTTGNEGLNALEECGSFDVLVTNIRLADGPDGWALARRARELNPSIGVLYVSGDSASAHDREGVEGSLMLTKPFLPDEVCAAVASIFEGSAQATGTR